MLLPRFARQSHALRSPFLITCALLAAAASARGQVTLDPLPVPAFGGAVTATERVGDMLLVAGSFLVRVRRPTRAAGCPFTTPSPVRARKIPCM